MSGRRPLVAGNWKMNTTVDEGIALAGAVRDATTGAAAEVAVLPPFTHLWAVSRELRETHVGVGAQNVFWERSGAFTGEISAEMLRGLCTYVLTGHSERRHILGESDSMVARKTAAAHAAGLRVIVAVGETEEERDAGRTHEVVRRQLDAVFAAGGAELGAATDVAYEPVWAIGTGRTATAEQAQEVCAAIRERLRGHIGEAAETLRVLYGGSVTPANAAELFACPDIDGGLIGGASLKPADFAAIVAAAGAGVAGGAA